MKKNSISYAIFALVAIAATGLMLYFQRTGDANDNQAGNNNTTLTTDGDQRVIYSVRRVTDATTNGSTGYSTSVFVSAIDGADAKQIYQVSDNAQVSKLADGSIGVMSGNGNRSTVTRIDTAGQMIRTYIFEYPVNGFIVSADGQLASYSLMNIAESSDGGLSSTNIPLTIEKADGSKIQYTASKFITHSSAAYSQVKPLAFSSDGSLLYVEVWPSSRGGDIVDPHGYFSVDVASGAIEEIVFSGSRKLDYAFDPNNPAIGDYIVLPRSAMALETVITNVDPRTTELRLRSLSSDTDNLLLTLSSSELEASSREMSTVQNGISPDETTILLNNRDNSVTPYDITGAKVLRNLPNVKNAVGWLSGTEIVYRDYRQKSWDDQQYSLKVYNLTTNASTTVYTQLTDHVEGAGLSQSGDEYYEYVGSVE